VPELLLGGRTGIPACPRSIQPQPKQLTTAALMKSSRQSKDRRAFFGGTIWRGRRAMRVSVCNWQTSDENLILKTVRNWSIDDYFRAGFSRTFKRYARKLVSSDVFKHANFSRAIL
jgi:hypothetical protein